MTKYYGYMQGCDCEFCKNERAREAADKAADELAAAEAKAAAEAAPVVLTSRLLTEAMVLKGSPCYEYRNRFSERYGENGVEVTVEKALSESDDWDWEWAGKILLSRKAKAEFSRRSREAEKKYDKDMKPYWDLVNAAYNEYYNVRDEVAVEAQAKGLRYSERYDLMDKASAGIMEVPNAASNAADKIAMKMRSDARITAFAELFIQDGAAYEEEHKDAEPCVIYYDEPDEDDDYSDDYDENEDY